MQSRCFTIAIGEGNRAFLGAASPGPVIQLGSTTSSNNMPIIITVERRIDVAFRFGWLQYQTNPCQSLGVVTLGSKHRLGWTHKVGVVVDGQEASTVLRQLIVCLLVCCMDEQIEKEASFRGTLLDSFLATKARIEETCATTHTDVAGILEQAMGVDVHSAKSCKLCCSMQGQMNKTLM